MSSERKLRPDEAWDAVMDMVRADEARRLEALSAEELDREVAASGRDPQAERARGAALAARFLRAKAAKAAEGAGTTVERPAKEADAARSAPKAPTVVTLPAAKPSPARRQALLWLLAAAFAVGLVMFVERREVIAWFKGDSDKIEPDHWGPQRERTPVEQAERLRDEAERACKERLWGTCALKLDDAMALDPAGETQPRVQALRADVYQHTHLPDGGPGPKDRPKGP